jgi:hypothetical protein
LAFKDEENGFSFVVRAQLSSLREDVLDLEQSINDLQHHSLQ